MARQARGSQRTRRGAAWPRPGLWRFARLVSPLLRSPSRPACLFFRNACASAAPFPGPHPADGEHPRPGAQVHWHGRLRPEDSAARKAQGGKGRCRFSPPFFFYGGEGSMCSLGLWPSLASALRRLSSSACAASPRAHGLRTALTCPPLPLSCLFSARFARCLAGGPHGLLQGHGCAPGRRDAHVRPVLFGIQVGVARQTLFAFFLLPRPGAAEGAASSGPRRANTRLLPSLRRASALARTSSATPTPTTPRT